MEQNQIQPEVLSSIALLNVDGQPYIEYNVNGMRDAFALNWEQVSQLQDAWRGDLFNFRTQRQNAIAEREKEEAEKQGINTPETEDVPAPIPNTDAGEDVALNRSESE